MKIQRFSAPDMREAMKLIREELGPEAVILETTKSRDGVEVSAAVDFDPALYQRSKPAAPARAEPALRAEAIPAYAASSATEEATSWHPEPLVRPVDTAPVAMTPEDDSVRCMLEARLSRLIWDDMRRRNPAVTNVMRNLSRMGLTPDVIEQLMEKGGDLSNLDNSWSAPLNWLRDSLPVLEEDLVMRGGVFAVAGPTGVGKTTSVAKLAARYALRHGAEDIALVSTDNFRIGAREQLETFARIIGVPVYSVPDPARLDETLAGLRSNKLVLIDTAGMGQRDVRMVEQLTCLRRSSVDISLLLAMPANVQTETIQEIVNVFTPSQPTACILTKVDEASSLGGAFSALIRAGLPLAYVCDGQRVPEDLHQAKQRVPWLIKTAVDCMRNHAPRIGKDTMADKFVKVAVNA